MKTLRFCLLWLWLAWPALAADVKVSALPRATTLSSNSLVSASYWNGAAHESRALKMSDLRYEIYPVIDVRTYGADGGGVVSCGTNIQRAIDAACQAGGGVVEFPPGIYNLGQHLPWDTLLLSEGHKNSLTVWSNNVTLRGSGIGRTVIRWGTNNLDSLRNMLGVAGTRSGTNYNVTNFAAVDITFDGQLTTNAQDTTQIYNCYGGIRFIRCEFKNNLYNDGIDTQYGGPLYVRDCVFAENGGNSIGVQNTATEVIGCHILSGGFSGPLLRPNGYSTFEPAIEFYDGGPVTVSDTIIEGVSAALDVSCDSFTANNCRFVTTNAAAVASYIVAIGRTANFNNCIFQDGSAGGSVPQFIVHTNRAVQFNNCEMVGQRPFLSSYLPKQISITSCKFGDQAYASTGDAINISKGTNIIITGNLFHLAGGSRAIVMTNAGQQSIIANNVGNANFVIAGESLLSIAGNVFSSGAGLIGTNVSYSTISGNMNGALAWWTASVVNNNTFSGNNWLSLAGDSYFMERLAGDRLTNGPALFGTTNLNYPSVVAFGQIQPNIGTTNYPGIQWPSGAGIRSDPVTAQLEFIADTGVRSWYISPGGTLNFGEGSGQVFANFVDVRYGDASSPGYKLGNNADPDTGFYRPLDNTWGWSSGGTTRMLLTTTNAIFSSGVIVGTTSQVITGTGSPESVVTAQIGSLFLRTDGGASTTLYVKTSGTGNTGWTAK